MPLQPFFECFSQAIVLTFSSTAKSTSDKLISLRQGISINYLEQLFLKLKKNNIVKSIRGKKGGYVLSKSAKEINLSDILFAVEEKVKTIACEKHSKDGCNGKSAKCITHNLWDELEVYINNFFQRKTLGDLMNSHDERV